MTDLRVVGPRMVVLHFEEVSCAVTASDLVAIDHDGPTARISIDGPPRDLADYLPHCSSSGAPMRLIVEVGGCRRALRTRARIELIETSLLYRMPRVLRDCGCAAWLRGIALLDQRPALWLDLICLASAFESQPTNQKEMS
jgi:hypothetical protein